MEYCNHILDRNRRETIPETSRGLSRVDSFFPFDPFLLVMCVHGVSYSSLYSNASWDVYSNFFSFCCSSKQFIADIYQEYQGAADEESSDESDSVSRCTVFIHKSLTMFLILLHCFSILLSRFFRETKWTSKMK